MFLRALSQSEWVSEWVTGFDLFIHIIKSIKRTCDIETSSSWCRLAVPPAPRLECEWAAVRPRGIYNRRRTGIWSNSQKRELHHRCNKQSKVLPQQKVPTTGLYHSPLIQFVYNATKEWVSEWVRGCWNGGGRCCVQPWFIAMISAIVDLFPAKFDSESWEKVTVI